MTSKITAGEVIVQSTLSSEWLNNNAALTGIMGTVVGAAITKISDLILAKASQQKERREKIEKLKGYLAVVRCK